MTRDEEYGYFREEEIAFPERGREQEEVEQREMFLIVQILFPK